MDENKLKKIQTVTDVLGMHWSVPGLESNKTKENNSAILVLDDFFEAVVKNGAVFNMSILQNSLRKSRDKLDYSFQHQVLMHPLMTFSKYKELLGQEIHLNFLECSILSEGFTAPNCLNDNRYTINLRNFIALKVISSTITVKDFLAGWKPNYFQELQENPKALLNAATNNPEDFKLFLKALNDNFVQFLIHLRTSLDRSHIYIMPKPIHSVSDVGAYYLDLPRLNIPLDKIKATIPFEQSHQDFLKKVIYCPISATHIAVAVPYSLTFTPKFPGEFKHLIEGFVASDLPEYVELTNAKILILPPLEVDKFLQKTKDMILKEPFDLMLMSRALSTIARRNVDEIMESLKSQGKL